MFAPTSSTAALILVAQKPQDGDIVRLKLLADLLEVIALPRYFEFIVENPYRLSLHWYYLLDQARGLEGCWLWSLSNVPFASAPLLGYRSGPPDRFKSIKTVTLQMKLSLRARFL